MARPKIEIDEEQVEKLAAMHCSNKEIAAFFDVSVDTITDRFSDILAKGREKGNIKLRRLQWQSAEKGNVTMQIWLGKQYLGQADKIIHDDQDLSFQDPEFLKLDEKYKAG